MLELTDLEPAFDVQESEYHRLLGFPRGHVPGGRSHELATWARAWFREHGSPWWYARQAEPVLLGETGLSIEGTGFASPTLRERMAEARAHAAMLVAVSAGPECEETARRLWEEEKPDEYFFLEVYGSAVVEALLTAAAYRLCEWADAHGLAVLPHYSPGYPEWDIADQAKLRSLVWRGGPSGLPADVKVLDTGMLVPKKSLLAVFGLTREVARVARLTGLVPCTGCSLRGCRYRRAPYRHAPPSLEEASPPAPEENRAAAPLLTREAEYSTNPAVLERWAQRRLMLEEREDGGVEATFRYDGTTCSNMGRPLAFEYHVTLSSREDGYRIIEARCAPAPDDIGHTCMCEYLADPQGLMGQIAQEAPLLGRPLEDVLTWQRGRNPEGCYCDAGGREHKWGLAYETLHYALSRDAAAITR